MVNVPSDDIVLSTFKRSTVWKLANFNKNNILDEVFQRGILKDYFRSKYENNYFYYNRENNLIVKICKNVKYLNINLYFIISY